ncbi:MAG: hydroxyacylglutathione hydrolase [Candidatus Methylomirabilis sp.]|nr:hydroxyacylglutathione hydrolase [Deltaproteobacteria bacterium]
MTVHAVPALDDNYVYLIHDGGGGYAVVDPAEARPVLEELKSRGGRLEAILLTHHHGDHVGGVKELMARTRPVAVYGPRKDKHRIPEITVEVDEDDWIDFGGEKGRVIFVPGHTTGHIAYHFPNSRHLFCGDVLFGAGCGRPFECPPAVLHQSLRKLMELPDDTLGWCGHEYTKSNLRFARTVDPDNAELEEREKNLQVPSVPLDLGQEKRTNPFLRCHEVALQQATGRSDPDEVFAELRERKNNFR